MAGALLSAVIRASRELPTTNPARNRLFLTGPTLSISPAAIQRRPPDPLSGCELDHFLHCKRGGKWDAHGDDQQRGSIACPLYSTISIGSIAARALRKCGSSCLLL